MNFNPESLKFVKLLERIGHKSGHVNHVFYDFVTITACALAYQTREEEYLRTIRKYKREHLDIFVECFNLFIDESEHYPFTDLLGPVYCHCFQSNSAAQIRGEFYTPQDICRMMVKMTAPDLDETNKIITVGEPACGSGTMILAFGELMQERGMLHRIRVTAQDVSDNACNMCFINTTLWAIPTKVIVGDTLKGTAHAVYYNLPWVVPMNLLQRQSCFEKQGKPPNENEQQVMNAAIEFKQEQSGQLLFSF